MKKKLFLALLTTLVLLLGATAALAESYSDYTCPECYNPCDSWHSYTMAHFNFHAPLCSNDLVPLYDVELRCTPADDTATCVDAPTCSVCSSRLTVEYGPDPDAHSIVKWSFYSPSEHYRFCALCHADDTYEFQMHQGGTATCTSYAVCDVCETPYGEFSDQHNAYTDWELYDDARHYRYCEDCYNNSTFEYEAHYGGTATCYARAVCEGCGWGYGEYKHANMSVYWYYYDNTQHYRECEDCYNYFEYGDHTGGTVTCGSSAICSVCGLAYSSPPTNEHINFSDWTYCDEDTHYLYCLDCGYASEYAPHSGGNGLCTYICEDCDEVVYDVNGRHRTMTSWDFHDDTQHYRYCLDCGQGHEYNVHTGGDGTCKPTCEDCGRIYADEDGEHLTMSDWGDFDSPRHSRSCLDCGNHTEYAPHTSGNGSCMHICEDCNEVIYHVDGEHRNMSDWFLQNDTQHYRFCLDCGDPSTYEYADHTDSDGSCKPLCEDCGERYYDDDGEHRSMSDWRHYSDTQHYRYCQDCRYVVSCEYAPHSGGDGSCMPVARIVAATTMTKTLHTAIWQTGPMSTTRSTPGYAWIASFTRSTVITPAAQPTA